MTLVRSAVDDAVCTVTLDDPDRLNPISQALATDLHAAIAEAGRDQRIRCVLLTGNGRAFSAGGDLSSLGTLTPASISRFLVDTQAIIQAIAALPVPVVVAVNGVAAGAGFSLAMAGDILLAAESASFHPAFSRVGAVPDLGLVHTLHRSIGIHRTTDILLRGTPIDARTAKDLGLVSEIVPDGRLRDEAMAVARELAEGPTVALGLTKKLIRLATSGGLASYLAAEADAQGIAFSTDDLREGVEAFQQRRAPNFKGR